MKHIMKHQFIVLFILFIIITLAIFGVNNVHAQEITQQPTPTPTIVQYDLAFPGILPDNFLYKLKVLRDKIQLIVTTDPKKRIELLLQLADKGVLASAMLVDKKEWTLAKETVLKAENNMTLLSPEIYRLDDPIDQKLLKKIQRASQKHQEVLAKLRERASGETQTVFSQVIDFSKRNQSEIEKFIEQ